MRSYALTGLDRRVELSGLDPLLRDWLADVAAGLVGPRRWQGEVVAELRDGLLDALEHHRRGSVVPGAAARAVLDEFGDPRTVAAGFVDEAAAGLASRVGGGVLASGPAAAAAWLVAFAAADVPLRHGQLTGVWWAMPVVGLLLALVVPAAVLAAALGRRWSPDSRATSGRATRWAQVAAAGCGTADILMLTLLGAWVLTGTPSSPAPAAVVAVVFSLGRGALAVRATRACAAVRAALV